MDVAYNFLTGNDTKITTEPVTDRTIPTNPSDFTVSIIPTISTSGKRFHGSNHYEYNA